MTRSRIAPVIMTAAAAAVLGVLVAYAPVAAFGVVALLSVVLIGMKLERVLMLAITSELVFTGIGKVFQLPLGPLSLNGSVLFDVLVMGLGILALVRRRSRFFYKEQTWFYLVLVIAGISGAFSLDPAATVKGVVKLLSFVVMYAVAREVGAEGDEGFARVMTFIAYLMMGVAALALYEWVIGVNPITLGSVTQNIYSTTGEAILELRRSRSTFSHPNQMAVVMASLGVLMVGVWRWDRRRLFAIAAAAGAVAVMVSFSRIVWGGVLIAGLVVLFGVVPRNRRIAAALGLVFAGFALWRLLGELVQQRLGFDSSAALRLRLLETGVDIVGGNPFIGIGYESFGVVTSQVFGYRIEAHSDYLRLYVETGVLGVLAFSGWIIAGFVRMRRLAVAFQGQRCAGLFVAGSGAIILFAVFAVTDNAIQGMGMLILVLGMLEGLGIDGVPSSDPLAAAPVR